MKINQGDEIRITAETSIKGVPAHPGEENKIVGKDIDAADARILIQYKLAEHIPHEPPEPPAPPVPEGEARKVLILNAVRTILTEGEALTQKGLPEVDAIEELLGFDITADERNEAMDIIKKEEEVSIPEGEERKAKILEAAREVMEKEETTQDGLPEVKAIEDILGFDISADERDETFETLMREIDVESAVRGIMVEEKEVTIEAVKQLSGYDTTEEELKNFVEIINNEE